MCHKPDASLPQTLTFLFGFSLLITFLAVIDPFGPNIPAWCDSSPPHPSPFPSNAPCSHSFLCPWPAPLLCPPHVTSSTLTHRAWAFTHLLHADFGRWTSAECTWLIRTVAPSWPSGLPSQSAHVQQSWGFLGV